MQYPYKSITLFVKPIIWLAIIFALCLVPVEDLPGKSLGKIPYFDKLVHFGMYFILSVLLAKPLIFLKLQVWPVTLMISLFIGGVIEILQFVLTNYRSASWGDFAADFAGAVAGLLVYGLLIAGKRWEKYL